MGLLPDVFISDVVQPGLPSRPSQHTHFGLIWVALNTPPFYCFIIFMSMCFQVQRHIQCRYPCQCDSRELRCKAGVSRLVDGCDCCYMCSRQAGDVCSIKDRCDEGRSLYCDFRGSGAGAGGGGGNWGYCRGT